MKGNGKLIQKRNGLLADELAALNQYIVHSEAERHVSEALAVVRQLAQD